MDAILEKSGDLWYHPAQLRAVGVLMFNLKRQLSKPSESELLLGDTERRSGVYMWVHEHSSTGLTQQETDYGGLVEGEDNVRA
jgi:RPE1 domain-containing protein